ncbi:MAG: hypothetical protein ACI8T1_003539 [Verrucomicrobiales bacterium]|jgi:hypothetical protein
MVPMEATQGTRYFYKLSILSEDRELLFETPLDSFAGIKPVLEWALIAYWPLNQPTADVMGNYHGVLKGDTLTFKSIETPVGHGLHLDGSGQCMEIIDEATRAFDSQTLSIALWVKPEGKGGSILLRHDLDSWIFDYVAESNVVRFEGLNWGGGAIVWRRQALAKISWAAGRTWW